MNIDYYEVLNYLGYKNRKADENIERLIKTCILEIGSTSKGKYLYDFFKIKKENEKIILQESNLVFPGKDIANHLKHSVKCAVMAVTLGIEIDKKIAFDSKMDLTKAMVMDACASAAVEALCDEVENEIKAKASQDGFYITSRYSPGYGDFPLKLQQNIINVLACYRKIGLSATKNSLLIPRKSVTAVIGLQQIPPNTDGQHGKCTICRKIDCQYRKDGNLCEKTS